MSTAIQAPAPLASDLCWLLARASHALTTELTSALESSGISPRAHSVLATAMTGEYTQTELARLVGLDKTTMVVTVDELEAAGLAERVKAAGTEEAQVRMAFEIAYQRDPTPEELAAAVALLHESTSAPDERAVVNYQPVALNAKPAGGASTSMDAAPAAGKPAKAKVEETPLQALCWALLSSNEFLFLN